MIIVIDFGGQTAHLIGRRLRQLGVGVEYTDPEEALTKIKDLRPTGVILSGGPAFVFEEGAPTVDPAIFTLGIPVLGICYGWQLMAHLLGGKVEEGTKEFGPEPITFTNSGTFGVPVETCSVYMSHGCSVTALPKGFSVIGSSRTVKNAAVENKTKHFYGLLFHPEADHTEHGLNMLQYFAETVCGEEIKPFELDPDSIIKDLKQKIGNKKVICAVSGGVDSTVAASLIGKAIGKQLIPVYVESGLMRPKTLEHVEYIFKDLIPADLVVVHARERFMNALKGIDDPETKRKTIGKLYVDIFQEIAIKHKDAAFLGQGTIYSDVIESKGSKHASHIKSHHNVGGLPKDMKLQLIEPNRNYYKDEVRQIGRLIGLPEEVVMQQPMPGPGHAINVRGEVTEKRLAQVIVANEIVVEELKKASLYDKVFECFAVMTGAYSTAVKGDGRAFAEVVAVRSIDTNDLMTVTWSPLPYDVLQKISSRIVNEVPDVSRVVYDITTKPPATVRWE
jgi:GMP synthase (glutamine-hydrolysing)